MNPRILALITIAITFILLNLGGYVHNTGSSLACPDWPLCYGQFFPKMVRDLKSELSVYRDEYAPMGLRSVYRRK